MKIFYNIRYVSINDLEPISVGIVAENDDAFYAEQIFNIQKCIHDIHRANLIFCQNENEKNRNMIFSPKKVHFNSSTLELSLNLRHFLSNFQDVEFSTLSNDCYQQFILNKLLFSYKESLIQQPILPFPDKLNILGINYNLSQDISRYLNIKRPPTVREINDLLFQLRMDPYMIHEKIHDNSLYLANLYKKLYERINKK